VVLLARPHTPHPYNVSCIRPAPSNLIIMKHKIDIPRPRPIRPHKVIIPLWPLLLRVAGEHRLQADANGFHVVDGRPALAIEQVEADDAVGVHVRVPGDGV